MPFPVTKFNPAMVPLVQNLICDQWEHRSTTWRHERIETR